MRFGSRSKQDFSRVSSMKPVVIDHKPKENDPLGKTLHLNNNNDEPEIDQNTEGEDSKLDEKQLSPRKI